MEPVARLAGEIADDFNDLLTVIAGFSQEVHARVEPGDPLEVRAKQAMEACQRSAIRMRQLLVIGGRGAFEREEVCLNRQIRGVVELLDGILGDEIVLATELCPDPALVHGDPVQIEQILLHLIVNARDAMPGGGKLTLRTEKVELDRVDSPERSGRFLRLSVVDTGHGMDEGTLDRIFEPFFSTRKEASGLGLATVYALTQWSGGEILVESEPGKGTTFTLHFPAAASTSRNPRDELWRRVRAARDS